MPEAAYSIAIGGHNVLATAVEFDGGWLHADVIRFRDVVTEDESAVTRQADRVERQHFPAAAVQRVRDLRADS